MAKFKFADIMKSKKAVAIFAMSTGLCLYSLHVLFIFLTYPNPRVEIFWMLILVFLGVVPLIFFVPKMDEKYLVPMLSAWALIASFIITVDCIFTGGFASNFYVAQMGAVIITSVIYYIKPKQFLILVLIFMLQHHFILLFFPWGMKDLLRSLIILIPYSTTIVIIHYIVFYFQKQTKALLGYIPICANCKKIRDDQGAWNQIEKYVADRTVADFKHSICPECMEKL